jgi:cytochrome c
MTSGVASGKMAFDKTCRACHSINPGGAGIGPTLAGVVGRKAGTVPNFDYSDQIRNSGITWTADNIDKHIEAPKSFIPGNRMGNLFPNGIKDPGQRRDIIVYLKSVAQ